MNNSEKLLDSLNSVTLFFKDLEIPYKIGNKEVNSLMHILSHVKDFRYTKID